MQPKIYKQLKDRPGVKAGTIHELKLCGRYWPAGVNNYDLSLPANLVENNPDFFEPVVERDWEIMEFTTPKGLTFCRGKYISLEDDYMKYGGEIKSVKRLSDNEVFKVGDNTDKGVIISIKVIEDKIVISTSNTECAIYFLSEINKVKPTPILTTEDGVEFNIESKYCGVQKETLHILDGYHFPLSKHENWLIFSTREAAEKYVIYKKVCLSFADISDFLIEHELYLSYEQHNDLEQIVKDKLKL